MNDRDSIVYIHNSGLHPVLCLGQKIAYILCIWGLNHLNVNIMHLKVESKNKNSKIEFLCKKNCVAREI